MKLFELVGEVALKGFEEAERAVSELDEGARGAGDGLGAVEAAAGDASGAAHELGDAAGSAASGVESLGDGVGAVEGLGGALQETAGKAGELGAQLGDVAGSIQSAGGELSKFVTGPIAGLGAAATGLVGSLTSTAVEIDRMAMQSGVGVETFQELAYAMDRVSKIGENDTARMLGRLTQRIGRAQQGNQSYIEALQDLGFSLGEIESGAVTTEGAFEAFVQRLQQAESDSEAMAIAAELLGTRLGRQVASGVREAGDEIDSFRERAREMGAVLSEETVAAANDFADQSDDLRLQLVGVSMAVGSELLPVFSELVAWFEEDGLPIVRDFGESLGGLVERFKELDQSTQRFILGAAGMAAALGPLVALLGLLLKPFAAILKVVGALASLKKAALIPAAVALAKPLLALTAGAAGLYAAFKLVPAALELVGQTFEWIRERMAEFVEFALAAAGDIVEGLVGAFTEGAPEILSAFVEWIKAAWEAVVEWVKETLAAVAQWVEDLIRWFIELPSKVRDALAGLVSAVLEAFKSWIGETITSVKQWASDIVQGIRGAVTGAVAALASLPAEGARAVASFASASLSSMSQWGSGMRSAVEGVASYVTQRLQAMAQQAARLFQQLRQRVVGNSIVPDMVDQIADEMDRMVDVGVGGAAGMYDAMTSAPAMAPMAAAQAGSATAGGVHVDMRHAIFRDDRDMLDRLARSGTDMTGAF